ncbi:GPI-linked NAD(P)(+)--arginine ADP-ribosyltransferase 1 [Merluccius polli]|uniref:NAD(P)(+)--arginine ADP-ribosyltransferase n=1 Tax=Merluccius polli TaxID=89951 RepID=A0AA47MV83_MERPO|nr:GPI-linked NAD(P)(+)--arginine ADP-ribosyltransferase 1 [Merluccius polli]
MLLFHDPFLISWWHEKPVESRKDFIIPLDMETDSIDDMYAGCRSETAALIDQLGVVKWHVNNQFSQSWTYIEAQAKRPAHKHLRDDHAKVLYMYTFWKLKDFRESFDQKVKALKQGYSTYGFRFHYLYFYLTDAIQMLRGNQTWCRTTYLHTDKRFSQGVINEEIRLGTFTLTASKNTSHLSSDAALRLQCVLHLNSIADTSEMEESDEPVGPLDGQFEYKQNICGPCLPANI